MRGCIHAVNLWMSDNIGITAALCCAIGLPQVTTTPWGQGGRGLDVEVTVSLAHWD